MSRLQPLVVCVVVLAGAGLSAVGQKNAGTAPVARFNVERLATCQDSWLEWKDDPVRLAAYLDSFHAGYRHSDTSAFFVPIGAATIVGLKVTQIYPGTIGMGVGFSAQVEGTFDVTKRAVERATGKTLTKCEQGDGMRTCSVELAEKKTLTLMSGDAPATAQTLVGCYYYYEK